MPYYISDELFAILVRPRNQDEVTIVSGQSELKNVQTVGLLGIRKLFTLIFFLLLVHARITLKQIIHQHFISGSFSRLQASWQFCSGLPEIDPNNSLVQNSSC